MASGDSNPFGYIIADYNADSNTNLLDNHESQTLTNFFLTNDPNNLNAPQFTFDPGTKDGFEDLDWNYVPPATVHGVSATIPDQAQLHNGFHYDPSFAPEPLRGGHLGNTQDDLRAASTLFTNANAQTSYTNGRAHSFHGLPSTGIGVNHLSALGLRNAMPMVPGGNGLLPDQLAALLPNHAENGSLDHQIAADFASNQAQHHLADLERQRPMMKRSYTYGTDTAFNSNGSATRPAKTHRASLDETSTRRKRLSSVGQKAQRENLSDEQKRSNHILSEQKRRNLIKRGFDDLHDLVPELRNGGLSKSGVLTGAANFLDKLIEENNHFASLSKAENG
ncbi:hypothetical protein K504DRAFT_434950 [Pleomassaria siparia CBS 279.74]|uniref:BHLH domain-containing protein n=1 Tax=Pleomassaria siparia CBS 279.74 TaxID=1314801 RepID=A0A6G1K752_9PLEO|nr:hypothetical protein K504DRAFT_434950 [Pleomassaria siparia CBS 279.74]